MPWKIQKRGSQHCVVKDPDDGSDPAGCHDDREGAVAQLKALYANEVTAAAAAEEPNYQPDLPEVVGDPAAAGVALVSGDTGRVLMIQRALIDGEAAGGKWEFPGGKIDEGESPFEGARREFGEETGHPLPDGEVVATWLSPNGIYRGFVLVCSCEEDFPMRETDPEHRQLDNPDNPSGSNYTESIAWFDPLDLSRGPKILREEVRSTPWKLIKLATPAGRVQAITAGLGEQVQTVEQAFANLRVSQESMPYGEYALPDGSVPIETVNDVENAIGAYGRGDIDRKADVRKHIIKRAQELGVSELIPQEWKMDEMTAEQEFESLVAALACPASAFLPEEPLPGPTPFSDADDGSLDGHLALWASCHIGYPGCVKPPREESFDFFNLGNAVTADGRRVPVGKVTVGTGHAGPDLSWRTAAAHYDDSGTAAGVVHATPDRWGIRLSGSLVASAEGSTIDELRRSPLSGDWRRINGALRLVAALGVNVPGYPVPRALVAAGEVQTMFVGFDLADAAAAQAEADAIAESLGLTVAQRAESLYASFTK